jgi:hypothetical protein
VQCVYEARVHGGDIWPALVALKTRHVGTGVADGMAKLILSQACAQTQVSQQVAKGGEGAERGVWHSAL